MALVSEAGAPWAMDGGPTKGGRKGGLWANLALLPRTRTSGALSACRQPARSGPPREPGTMSSLLFTLRGMTRTTRDNPSII